MHALLKNSHQACDTLCSVQSYGLLAVEGI